MILYAEKGADENSDECKDGVNIMMLYMEEEAEMNSDGHENGANYLGYKLYVIDYELSCVYAAFG